MGEGLLPCSSSTISGVGVHEHSVEVLAVDLEGLADVEDPEEIDGE